MSASRSPADVPDPRPRIAAGTQVVLRVGLTDPAGGVAQRGATGRVVDEPGTAGHRGEAATGTTAAGRRYLVRLGDGRLVAADRGQLALRKHHQADQSAPAAAIDETELVTGHTILAVVVGSRAFGLDTDSSDTDTRGVYQAPTSAFWSMTKPARHVEGPWPEWFSWEVERFCELALRANPGCLEVLYSPILVRQSEVGLALRELRGAFVSQLVYQTYSGYVLSQFKKIEGDLRRQGSPKWKHVMHLLRLQLAAVDLLRTGELVTDVGEHREALLDVRRGERSWEQVEAWRLRLHRELDDALAETVLPAVPDVAAVDGWLREIRAADAMAGLR